MEELTKQSRKANYNNSKIFILEPSILHPKDHIFYSSTCQPLFRRLSQYKKTYFKKNNSYKWLFDKYGIDNIKIVLIEGFICNNKEELQAKEAKFIRENDCINKMITSKNQETKEDKQKIKEEDKQDKQEIEEIKEEDKQKNKEDKQGIEEIKEQIKEIKEEDKEKKARDKKRDNDKDYYTKHKDSILKKRRDKRQDKNKQEEEILLLKEKTHQT
jgi:hypothetical protein